MLTLNLSSDHPFLPTKTSTKAEFSFPISMPVIFVGFSNCSVTKAEFKPTFSHFHFLFASFSRFDAGKFY